MLYLYFPNESGHWVELFRREAREFRIVAWPEPAPWRDVVYVAAWNPPDDFFARFPGLKGVFVLGAGVDRILARVDLPAHVPLIRLTDAGMARQMAEYVLFGVLRIQRGFDRYAEQQQRRDWRPLANRAASEMRVSVLGLGAIGGVVAHTLADFGYAVCGWSRAARTLPGVRCVCGAEALDTLLAESDILVNVLPSTPETRGLLDRARLSRLPAGASIINVARGDQLDVDALIALVDSGHLRGAMLDVFPTEPLASDHPLWSHPKVLITPHVAAQTLPGASARQVVEKLRRLEAGEPVDGLVERDRAY